MPRRRPIPPWKRGPSAWAVAQRADGILQALAASPRRFLSLRAAARLFGVSTQPLRDWIKLGCLSPAGPRQRLSREELARFTLWLRDHAEPFDPGAYAQRFPDAYPFKKLHLATFVWPQGRRNLAPAEIAALVPCHPSLVLQAIHRGVLKGRRLTPCRWHVSLDSWRNAFIGSLRPPKKSLSSAKKSLDKQSGPKTSIFRARTSRDSRETLRVRIP